MSTEPTYQLLMVFTERLLAKETLELEFKSAQGGLPASLWSTVSAFANTRGGWIVLGVKEGDGSPVIEGIKNPDQRMQDIHNLVRNPNKMSCPVCGATDVEVWPIEDKQVVVMRVPAAPRKSRPVYIDGNPYTGTYVRRHGGDYKCSKPEVDRMMRDASEVGADSTVLRQFSLDALDSETLAHYRRRYQTHNPGSPWNAYDDLRFLRAIGGFRHDSESGAEGITVAGLLMLGTPEALREWRGRHLIDYRYISDSSTDRWDDRIPWEGNLLGAFEVIYPRLTANQPVPFRLEGSARIDESHAHEALREAFVNLLVHADYAETEASLIKSSPEGHLFRNPGDSRIPDIDLLSGDRSDPRNPELVRMLRYIGLAEEAGTGIPRIVRAWKELGFLLPAIDVGTERYEFTIELRHVHMLSDDDRSWLSSLPGVFNEGEQLALVRARHDGDVDNSRLRNLTGQHPFDVTKVLGGLRDRGLLEMIGVGRGAHYVLGPLAIEGLTSTGTAASSVGKAATSTGKDASSEYIQGSDTEARLNRIAKVAQERRRLPPEDLADIILELCSVVPLSLRELARLLRRSQGYTRVAVRDLVSSRRLSLLIPDQPTHPLQKYLTSPTESR